ncbi:MAG: FAD:protein FMN transferase [Candidatus Latescibacteria bacterium]|nr:FAD:protein FMN transferase [Candidatus Latescibacterota bacterium]
MKRILTALIPTIGFLLILLFVVRLRTNRPPPLVEITRPLLGTTVTIKAVDTGTSATVLAVEQAFEEMWRIDSLMTDYTTTSELVSIERQEGSDWRTVSDDLFSVIRRSQEIASLSHGAFDITIGAIKQLWDFTSTTVPHLPPPERITEQLQFIGYHRISLDENNHRIRVPSGTVLDLGGVATGYAVDRAIEILQKADIHNTLIDAGGDIRTMGRRPDGTPWVIAIQHPREERLITIRDVGLSSVATSGDYQQYFEIGGHRYHHIFDPATGYPVTHSISATVWAETTIDADILSTTVFVLGPEEGITLIEQLGRAEALIFYVDNGTVKYRMSRGMIGKVDV